MLYLVGIVQLRLNNTKYKLFIIYYFLFYFIFINYIIINAIILYNDKKIFSYKKTR